MEDGRPFLDMAHVITSLNRLDAGIPDKVAIHKHFVIIIFGGKRQQKAHNKLGPGLFDVEGWTKRVGRELCGAEELFGAGKDWYNISIIKTSNQTISIITGWEH